MKDKLPYIPTLGGLEYRPKQYDHINPNHYKKYSFEVIDMMVKVYGPEHTAIYCEMNAFKYTMRVGLKPEQPVERDLEKRDWYLNKAAELRNSIIK